LYASTQYALTYWIVRPDVSNTNLKNLLGPSLGQANIAFDGGQQLNQQAVDRDGE